MTRITKLWAVFLVIITTLLVTAAQILLKIGVSRFPELLSNYPLLAGILLYAIGSVLMIIAFKGGEVSVLYPILATSYLWVAFSSMLIFNEHVTAIRWTGIGVIMAGITVIGIGSRNHNGIEHMEAA